MEVIEEKWVKLTIKVLNKIGFVEMMHGAVVTKSGGIKSEHLIRPSGAETMVNFSHHAAAAAAAGLYADKLGADEDLYSGLGTNIFAKAGI